jgi:hypothetical protein
MNALRGPAEHSQLSSASRVPVLSDERVRSSLLVKFGGFLGIAGCTLGLILLIVGCAGFGKALSWSMGCVAAGAFGMLVTLAGAFWERRKLGEETHVLQALFACFLSILGGLMEMAVWLKWPILK